MAAVLCEHCGRAYDTDQREERCPHDERCLCPDEGKSGHDLDCPRYEYTGFRKVHP